MAKNAISGWQLLAASKECPSKKKKERKKERMSLYFSKCGEDAEKLDHSHIADRNTKMVPPLWKAV